MNWERIISALAGLAQTIMGLFRDKELRQEGVTAQVATQEKETLDVVQTATQAREAVRAELVRNPDSLRDNDDGFRRPD